MDKQNVLYLRHDILEPVDEIGVKKSIICPRAFLVQIFCAIGAEHATFLKQETCIQ